MWKDIIIPILVLGLGQVLSQHKKRQSHPTSFKSLLGWKDITELKDADDKNKYNIPPISKTRTFGNFFWGLRWASNPDLLNRLSIRKRVVGDNILDNLKIIAARLSTEKESYNEPYYMTKRQNYNCDTTRITIQTIIEYLRTGRICGFRVSTMRFGLGRRR